MSTNPLGPYGRGPQDPPAADWGGDPPATPAVVAAPMSMSFHPNLVRTNGLAVASLVFSLLWIFWLGSIIGLLCGLAALSQTQPGLEDRFPQGGRGMAIAGVILSALSLLPLVLLLAAAGS